MRCLPELTAASDQPFWVPPKSFCAMFDQEDFLCREEHCVASAYLEDWFFKLEDGELRFLLPTVGVVGGKTQFISGRHRTAVLLPHLEELPIAFAVAHLSEQALAVLCRIPKRPLLLSEHILLPDLPVKERLP